VRPVAAGESFNAVEFLQRIGKSKPVSGVVEAVLNGSTLRVTLLPDLTPVTVHVSGVQCPSMGKRPPGAGTAVAAADSGTPAVTGESNGDAAAAAAAKPAAAPAAAPAAGPQPEPFAREAKWFSEQRALNREVRIVLDGVDKYQNLFGSVMYPEADKPASLAEGLVQAGLARCVEWSLQMMTVGGMRLREMERAVKTAKRGIWHAYVPVATGQTKLSDSFVGRVNEVSSGDTLIIKDVNAGVERRVQLSRWGLGGQDV
jgi:staphylococcal nuclease domain-containing protein 1